MAIHVEIMQTNRTDKNFANGRKDFNQQYASLEQWKRQRPASIFCQSPVSRTWGRSFRPRTQKRAASPGSNCPRRESVSVARRQKIRREPPSVPSVCKQRLYLPPSIFRSFPRTPPSSFGSASNMHHHYSIRLALLCFD